MNIHIRRLNRELGEWTGVLVIAFIIIGFILAGGAFSALVYYSTRGGM